MKYQASRTTDRNTLVELYQACKSNAGSLILEATLLFDNKHYARSFFLAFTALEELGKAEIVADFITGCIPEQQFTEAFKSHRLKHAYIGRTLALQDDGHCIMQYDVKDEITKKRLETRMDSLYVDFKCDSEISVPKEQIDVEEAQAMLDMANDVSYSILHAEWLNGIIGSKGLFK